MLLSNLEFCENWLMEVLHKELLSNREFREHRLLEDYV